MSERVEATQQCDFDFSDSISARAFVQLLSIIMLVLLVPIPLLYRVGENACTRGLFWFLSIAVFAAWVFAYVLSLNLLFHCAIDGAGIVPAAYVLVSLLFVRWRAANVSIASYICCSTMG